MFSSIISSTHARFYENIKAFLTCTLLPSACLLCGTKTAEALCKLCKQSLPSLPEYCPRCAHILHVKDIYCGRCSQNPPPFDRTFALFPYEAPIIQLIIQLKFHTRLPIAQFFSEQFYHYITSTWYQTEPLPDLILPIPLHRERLKERGFNQALEIAKPVAKRLGLPMDTRGIKRIKATAAQSGLSAIARKRNIQHAFKCYRDYQNISIALLDDVVTTGSTVKECSQLLKEQGARSVHVWCCAKRG